MKDIIIEKATHLFLKLGFKSVTMDDIAAQMGISKKTIYKYFENKEILIEAGVEYIHEIIKTKIQQIFLLNKNAVEENFIICEMFNELFQTDGDSPVYQLKKHYPLIYAVVREREAQQCKAIFFQNITKGIDEELYKNDINVEHAVLFYYMLIFGINETFQSEKDVVKLEFEALKYHIQSIATPKGLLELNNQLKLHKL